MKVNTEKLLTLTGGKEERKKEKCSRMLADILYALDQKWGGLWKYDQSDGMYKSKETVEALLWKKGECELIAGIERQDELGMRDNEREWSWDCDIVVNKFKLWLCYYIHFWTNTLWKGMNPLIPQLLLLFYKDGFGIK